MWWVKEISKERELSKRRSTWCGEAWQGLQVTPRVGDRVRYTSKEVGRRPNGTSAVWGEGEVRTEEVRESASALNVPGVLGMPAGVVLKCCYCALHERSYLDVSSHAWLFWWIFFLGRYWLFLLSGNIGSCISVSVTSAAEFVEILSVSSFLLRYHSSLPAGEFST